MLFQGTLVGDNVDLFEGRVAGHSVNNLDRLTDDPAVDGWASWSPDGTAFAFFSLRSGYPTIWIHDMATGADAQLLFEEAHSAAWQPVPRRELACGRFASARRQPHRREAGEPFPHSHRPGVRKRRLEQHSQAGVRAGDRGDAADTFLDRRNGGRSASTTTSSSRAPSCCQRIVKRV